MDTLDELCDKILTRIDIEELVDLLGITAEEILDHFQDKVLEKQELIKEAMFDE